MRAYARDCVEIDILEARVKELEKELERKDVVHLADLRLMKKQMEAIMNKYCLN